MSITTAVLITVIDVAIEKPIGTMSIHAANQLGFTSAFLAVTNICVAFCKHGPIIYYSLPRFLEGHLLTVL